VLKAGFRKCHRRPQYRLPLSCELREWLIVVSAGCFWCGLRHPKCDEAMHLALPPLHCKPVLSSIPIHNNQVGLSLETWLANCGDLLRPIHRPGKREFRKFLISREEWGGAPSCLKYIGPRVFKGTSSKSRGNSSCRNLRYAFPVTRTSKMKGPHQLIVQNCTPHIDTKTLFKVAFHSGVGILSSPHMRVVCIIDTVAIERNDATRDCHWATCKIPGSQQNRQVRDVAVASRGMDTCSLHAVFSTLSCGEHEDVLQFFAYSHVDCSVLSEQCLLHRSLH